MSVHPRSRGTDLHRTRDSHHTNRISSHSTPAKPETPPSQWRLAWELLRNARFWIVPEPVGRPGSPRPKRVDRPWRPDLPQTVGGPRGMGTRDDVLAFVERPLMVDVLYDVYVEAWEGQMPQHDRRTFPYC